MKDFEEMFGMKACYESVVYDIEKLGENPFEMLGRYIIRAEQDVFFNKRMIDALKQYMADKQIKWNNK